MAERRRPAWSPAPETGALGTNTPGESVHNASVRGGGAGWLPQLAYGLGALSILLLIVVGMAGPNAVALTLADEPGRGWLPPYDLDLALQPALAVGLTSAAVGCAAAALGVGMWALRLGWVPSARRLVTCGAVAAFVLLLVPPMASADVQVYAVYGRLSALGFDPYDNTARTLIEQGDSIGLATERPWLDVTSVYGPLATMVQELAARLGGGSMHDTVFWLALINAAAYVGAGALLVTAAGGDPARRARAALLWAANPLLIYVVVGGAHLDAQAIVLAVGALALLRRSPLGAGVLLGLAGAVKISLGLWGLGFLWALRRRPKDALLLCAGAATSLALTYGFAGDAAFTQLQANAKYVSPSTFWHRIYEVLDAQLPREDARRYVAIAAWVVIAVLVVVLLRVLPRADTVVGEAARGAAAISLAWVLGAQYVLPWYDAAVWAPLALVAASAADWLLLVHTGAYGFWYVASRALEFPPQVAAWASHRAPALRWVSGSLASLTVAWGLAAAARRAAGGVPGSPPPRPAESQS